PGSSTRGEGVRVAHTRPVLYGRYSAAITAPKSALGGVVTTFITMSDVKDEIDWEIVGQSATTAQSNIFYRGIEEVGIHGGTHALGGATSATHVYTIDWKPDVLTWSVDGKVVRTERRSESQRDSELTRAKFPDGPVQWYPNTPSIIQFSVWDGGDQPSAGTATWAGGPVNFGIGAIKAKYDYLEVQCYDD
ncbi:concanavalin A-like lectin/glucanase, partial [Caulochytrium protostelioides]